MWASGSRSKFRVWSQSSLRFFNQNRQLSKSHQRGPAFWSSSVMVLPQKHKVSIAKKKTLRLSLPSPNFLGITSWAQFLAILLAVVALCLFSVLMCYFKRYVQKADALNEQTLQMRSREKRLNDVIKLFAGDQGQHCKICRYQTWLQRGETCYRRTDFVLPWALCMEKCETRGGKLLKVETEGEMEFLLQESRKWVTVVDHRHVSQKIWIGLFFNLSQGTWHWADGELMHIRIRSMHVRKPCAHRECCMAISNGEAAPIPCNEQLKCLCKKLVR